MLETSSSLCVLEQVDIATSMEVDAVDMEAVGVDMEVAGVGTHPAGVGTRPVVGAIPAVGMRLEFEAHIRDG